MVRITKVYTKSGDRGMTSLGSGERVSKDSPRVEAYGTVDELNSVLGVLLCEEVPAELREELLRIQQELFDLGADLSTAESERKAAGPKIKPAQIERLEKLIDAHNDPLKPLTSFILPGGARTASLFHLARTVCRRAERRVVTLASSATLDANAVIYLNRLSDALFVLARSENARTGHGDILWDPRRAT
jgi:cob(I)alamin adenosyltransferase